MFESLETGIGLDIVLWLQDLRFGLLDRILELLDFAGDQLFFIAALALIYWIINKGLGIRLLFALIFIGLITSFFKDIFARPRPYQVSDLVMPLVTEPQFGIPSGHVTYAIVVWGYLALSLRKRWLTIAVVIYVILQCFARVMSGTHFPQDVVAGVIIGVISLTLYAMYVERVVEFWERQGLTTQIAIPTGLSILGLILISVIPLQQSQIDDYATLFGLLWGAGLAAAIESRYIQFKAADDTMPRALQYLIGIALSVALLMGLGAAFDAITETGLLASILRIIRYGLLAAFALGIWPYLSIRFNLMKQETELSKVPA